MSVGLPLNQKSIQPLHTVPTPSMFSPSMAPSPLDMAYAASESSSISSEDSSSCSESSGGSGIVDKVRFHETGQLKAHCVGLANFVLGSESYILHRDGAVLGKYPSIILPQEFESAEKVLLTIHLNHPSVSGEAGTAMAPTFVKKYLNDASKTLSQKFPLSKNQLWVRPGDLPDKRTIQFKKKLWTLSTLFRKICNSRWPKFIISVSAEIDGEKRVEISPEFEVRSKEQGHKTRAARGLAASVTKRRTPETEIRESELRLLHADIVNRRDQMQAIQSENEDMSVRFGFIRAILNTCHGVHAEKLQDMCRQHEILMRKWNS